MLGTLMGITRMLIETGVGNTGYVYPLQAGSNGANVPGPARHSIRDAFAMAIIVRDDDT